MTENFIAGNLKHLRKKNGLTQAHIRSRLGITRSTWSNYENGITEPSVNDLINFSRFFGITLDELIVQDLLQKDPLPDEHVKKVSASKVYAVNDAVSATGEPDIIYVMKELKKLREEIDTIKKTNT